MEAGRNIINTGQWNHDLDNGFNSSKVNAKTGLSMRDLFVKKIINGRKILIPKVIKNRKYSDNDYD